MLRVRSIVLLGLCVLAGCAATIDPVMKAQVDRQVAGLGNRAERFQASEARESIAPAPGQWARFKAVDKKGEPSFSTFKVLKQDGTKYWIEIEQESYYGHSALQYVLDMPDPYDPKRTDVLLVKSRDGKGRVTEIDGVELSLIKDMYRDLVGQVAVRFDDETREDAKVPAGTFEGAFRRRTRVAMALGATLEATAWSHPVVPFGGLLRSKNDDGSTMELVEFGLEGAKALIPY